MSQTVELARATHDAWNRRDLESTLARTHLEWEFRISGLFPGFNA